MKNIATRGILKKFSIQKSGGTGLKTSVVMRLEVELAEQQNNANWQKRFVKIEILFPEQANR